MTGELYTNTASTATTAAPIGPSDTTATLASFTGWPNTPFWAELEKGTGLAEIVRVTGVAGSSVTAMTRGQGGTSATSHGAGVNVELVAPADFFNRAEAHQALTSAHGVTGNIVGTSGAQTVSDKLFRGAAKSQHSDALPAGITASFESVADNSGARDGFVHRNTAGHVDRRGLLVEQSGTPRFQAFNDGSVDVAPGTSTRPGFRNHGTTTLDGAVTVNAALGVSTGGITVTAGGLTVSAGGANITGTTTTGVTNTGNLSSSGTIHANGAIDTDTNLTVDGTSTLTGAVTMGSTLVAAGSITTAGTNVGTELASLLTKLNKLNNPARARLRTVTPPSCTTGTFTAITWDQEDLDSANGHSSVTNNSRWTCPAGFDGDYLLLGGSGFSSGVINNKFLKWQVNGVDVSSGASSYPAQSGNASVFNARPKEVTLTAGDYVELFVQHFHGSTVSPDATSCYMDIRQLRYTTL